MKIQENNSGKIIDRNWLLKRKRKRVSCNSDVSTGEKGTPPESSRSPASTKKRRKDEMQFSQAEPKLRGHDGHYFECVACELGGNLLCCDSCPRTYHLTCLNPPLKHTPPGKWKCPTCLEQRDSLDPLRHPKVIFKRARTKSASKKARSDLKLQSFGKVLLSDPSTVSEDIGSFKKGKSTATVSEKKSGSFQTDNTCSTSSDYYSGNGTPVNTKSMGKHNALHEASSTSGRKIRSSIKVSNSCSSSKTPKVKPNLSDSSQMEPTALVSKPANRSKIKTKKITEEEDDIKLSCGITEEACRKKKKQRGKSITMMFKTTFKKKTLSPGVTGSHNKHNQSRQQISSLVNHDSSEHKITEGIEVGDLLKFGNEVLQVDRILGCRVKGNDLRSGCILTKNSSLLIDAGKSSTNIVNRLQSADETILETEEEQLHVREDDDNLREAKDAITALVEESNDVNNKSIREITDTCTTILDENNIDENDQKTSFKEEKHASLDEHRALNSSIPGEQDSPHEYEKGINEKKLSDVNIDPQLDAFYSGDHNVAEPNSVNGERAKDIIQTASEENLAQKSVELSGSDATYEFLVKWVGKSVIHTTWLPESQVKLLAKRKLENYKAKYGTVVINICQEQWGRPQRVIALRGTNDSNREALVKWCGLPYDECTWERLDEPIIQKCAHLISQFSEFESKTLIKDTEGNLPKVKGEAPEVVPLLKQPQELKGGSLFPHQLEALNWLRKCWHKSKNVILADEMGLGKTISACAFLSSVYHEFRAKLPSLVLVPLSTMPNWFAEFSLWAPHLNVVEYHGGTKARSVIRQYEWHASDPDRIHKLSKSFKFNVLLTTYEMILTDYSHLRGVPWEVLVVDEGHRLKNSGSKLFSMLNTFSFEHRILLTGTPLQNNIGEMYNLLNFLQPVSFPSLSAFEEKFNDLTTAEKVEELKKLVAPHMLRRLKKDAMQNIPPKTERMVPVELTSIQAEYYRAMLTKNYQILRNLGRGGVQSMLNIVMQLRKVCNHPYLIPGTEPESGSVEFLHEMRIKASAKLTLLHSMLKILHREGHRVLIFSQMTKLLDILEDYVTIEFGPKTFERVDGSVSVSDRQAAIARFNQDKSRFIFLLSTRSCGLGINLATADTVVIYDSDFNPHADIQAMNRAHRIGQSNRLLVYRLVVRASVEERILQLARKKLMLDQLFVNKSGSQKEVEDILRWGTEELFSDCDGAVLKDHNETCYNKLEAPVDGEQRHRRRVGGLGDVYQDRCTDGSTKVLWDENAILKLLDRSNLQFGSSDNVDADLDNDMLGSLKEWNDEPAEEQVGTELLPDDGVYGEEQAAENKEDNVANDIEENEWDRLLRIRWEKYQNEEEASLGRGKRLRKAVSYRETFATLQTETLSESGNDEEEQEPEYSPAGRAFKEKYSRLRARQKDRLLQRQTMGESCLASPLVHEPKGVLQPSTREGLDINDVALAQKYHITSQDKENINSVQLSHQMGIQTEPSSRAGRFTKHGHKRHQNSPLDFSVKPPDSLPTDIVLPSHQFHGAGSSASLPASNHLPVLGLCAPNASQMDAVKRNLNSSVSAALRSSDQNMTSTSIPEFPFPPPCDPGSYSDVNVRDREGLGTERLLPEFFSDTSNGYLKNIPNRYFPFNPHLPISSQEINTLIHINNSKSMLHASDEKMGLQDLTLDGNKLQRFMIPNMHGPISFSDVFHNLSLDMKTESRRELRQDFLNIPSAPNFRHLNESLKQKEQLKDPPTLLGLGQIEAANLLPNNHKKVLDNIMMRTSGGAHRSMKKKQKIATWSEDELDALWVGVRRHGRGNWDAMLRDSKLKFSRHRTPEDLAARWSQEQQKIMDVSALPVQKPPRSTSFPGVPDGMMARALFGSKFVGSGTHAPKFQSHLTDIKLGCGDLKPGMASHELKDHLGSMGGNKPLFPPWLPGTVPSNVTGDFGAGPSDIAAKLGLPFDLPFQQNPSFSSIADSLGLNCFNCPSMMQHEGKKSPIKFPNLLDRSPNFLYETQKNVLNTKLDAGCSQNRRLSSCQPFIKDDAVADCSKMKNLPHWLRDAVTVPAASPPSLPAPCLPPIISAIAHSVCLLYGPSTIPTFSMPGPPPLEPVDPRRNLKRTKKLPRFNQKNTIDIGSSKFFKITAAHDTSMFSLTPPIDPLCSDTNINLSSLNLNVKCSSPLSLVNHGKKISASPEELDFVASLVPGPVNLPSPVIQGTGNPDLPALEKSEASESFGMRMLHDIKAVRGKRKASNNSLFGDLEKLTAEKTCTRFESRGSSGTDIYSASASEVEVVKVSLEETLSDGHQSEQET